jgi:hypothetical protein
MKAVLTSPLTMQMKRIVNPVLANASPRLDIVAVRVRAILATSLIDQHRPVVALRRKG